MGRRPMRSERAPERGSQRSVSGDEVEAHGAHHDQSHAGEDHGPVGGEGGQHLPPRGVMAAGEEGLGLRQGATHSQKDREDETAHHQGDTKAPCAHRLRRQPAGEEDAQEGRGHHRHLLAGRLKAHVKALVTGGGDLREIDGHAPQLHPRREALDQAPEQHQQRREEADGGISRRHRDGERAGGHQPQGQQEAGPAPPAVDVRSQDDGADGAHEEGGSVGREGQEERGRLVALGEIGTADGGGEVAEHHEVVHLQEVAAGDAHHRHDPGWLGVRGREPPS
jgi:hypothetical protein